MNHAQEKSNSGKDEYWVSGCKKNGQDRHWAGGGPVEIDEAVREAYWRDVRGLIDLSDTRDGVMLKPQRPEHQ